MKRILVFAIMLCLFMSCTFLPKPGTMADYLPRDTDVPGWVLAQKYAMGSVKKIGQTVPSSSDYDPLEMAGAEYNYLSDNSRTISVRVIKFRSLMDAFGLYSRERGFDRDAQFTGDETYASGRGLYSYQGKFYVSVLGGPEGEPDPAALQQFLGVIRQNLKNQSGTDRLPDYILSLSERGSSRDIVYYKAGLDSLPGSRELLVTRRSISGKSHDLVYSRFQNAFDAEQTFHKILKAGSGSFMLTKIGSLQPAIKAVPGGGYMFISYYKQWMFGVLNAENMKEVNAIIIYLYGDIRVRSERKVSSAPEK
ncbi:MAG TPA: hypothetical protein PK307_02165 [Spirochaetota bacterium]|nr:hypothetical protein [Spirochaetota bacterium]HOD15643.1 hypothetical protein [Spirochaetota bacterium]HPG51668.1 hypothetical protein [Spirochaetota bacterium]HPN13922.1 hypothetical protein [Spirochaetota bacterium]HQL80980.1 hypothetical protein [Spirochaetota bacterium]